MPMLARPAPDPELANLTARQVVIHADTVTVYTTGGGVDRLAKAPRGQRMMGAVLRLLGVR